MKHKKAISIICVIICGFLVYSSNLLQRELSITSHVTVNSSHLKSNKEKKFSEKIPSTGAYTYIGKSKDEIIEVLGEPTRIEPSAYDYNWWIYNSDPRNYLQIGIEDDVVVTVYVIGEDVDIHPFYIGQSIEEIDSLHQVLPSVAIQEGKNYYRFELTENDLRSTPLVAIGDVLIQLYMDTYTSKLSSVRFVNEDTLLKQMPYELVYRGELPTSKQLTIEEWKAIENGTAAQILDLTNIIRSRHGLQPVLWDQQTSDVAYNHSYDMSKNQYFSHDSPSFGGLADRLAIGEVIYLTAGENIAAQYVDGIAAVEGWLNSEGHRETLLNEEFTHLGVGVYEKYYTQNFVKKFN